MSDSERGGPTEEAGSTRSSEVPPAAPERICPNCGTALMDSRCKLVCPDRACGYFMSCSDFY
ncbi:MAG: hypothetical protein ABR576_16310 [Thermoanaerobaculia bacterium]